MKLFISNLQICVIYTYGPCMGRMLVGWAVYRNVSNRVPNKFSKFQIKNPYKQSRAYG